MEQKLKLWKAGAAAALSALGTWLGWKGTMLLLWVGVMALDYLSGTLAALKAGQWSSAAARQGLWHKGGMLFVVLVAAMGDMTLALLGEYVPMGQDWPGLLLPLVLGWYILTELGSILENAMALGAPVPQWLGKLLKAGVKLVEDRAER